MEPAVKMPTNELALITWAGDVLKQGLSASINKNNSFIITYTGRSPELVRIISYGFIDKISTFYIDLKREKAKRDYEFATGKVDSLRAVMNTDKLEFRVPTENLIADKQMIRQQYANAIANQQNAAYKLQKATPLIKVLDKPEPPYNVQHNSPLLFGTIGFFMGIILIGLLIISGILIRFLKEEIKKAIFGAEGAKNTATTISGR
jgi:hypothetical protein